MSAIASLFSNIAYKTKKFIGKRLRGLRLFFNLSVKPSDEEKEYHIPASWRSQNREAAKQETAAPQIKVSNANSEPASIVRSAASNVDTSSTKKTIIPRQYANTTIDNRKFVMPKWHFPGLLKIKRLIAGLMLIVDIAFSQFILGSTSGATQIFMLLFIANAFILGDYIWKTRKPTKEEIQVERIRHSELQ